MLKDWLNEHDFTLSLSSGFFGFYAHCGLWKAFHEEGVFPSRITGASAGALVGAAMATGKDPDEFVDLIFNVERKDFWDPGIGLGFLRGKKFRDLLKQFLPQEFDGLKVPFESVVYAAHTMETQSINQGAHLPEMVVASCTVPFLFQPVRLGRQFFWDGGYKDKMAFTAVDPNERVFGHYLMNKRQSWSEAQKDVSAIADTNKLFFAIENLPRVTPFRLDRGPVAYYRAYSVVKNALQSKNENIPELLTNTLDLNQSFKKPLPNHKESSLNKFRIKNEQDLI